MGSPLFPIIADLVLQKLESDILNKFPLKLIFYYKFVDDIALSASYTCLNDFYMFNSFHSRLSFSIEIGDNTLNFLDLSLIKKRLLDF